MFPSSQCRAMKSVTSGPSPSRGRWGLHTSSSRRSLPLPLPSVDLAGRGRRAKRGRRRLRRPTFPRALESGSGPSLSLAVRRGWVVMVLWSRRGGVPWTRWWSPAAFLQELGNSGSRWARADLDGFGRAKAQTRLCGLLEVAATAWPVLGTAVWPACCSRVVGALWACLGSARPVWAWCAPTALSDQ
jgi:hypothetical protein